MARDFWCRYPFGYGPAGPRPALYAPFHQAALAVLDAGIAARQTRPCVFVVAGDSHVAGSEVGNPSLRWVDLLCHYLQQAFPLASGATQPAVGDLYSTPSNGINVLLSANAGSGAATYLDPTRRSLLVGKTPTVILHVVGSNDLANGVTDTTFGANLIAQLDAIDSTLTSPHLHVLLHEWARPGKSNAWARYAGVKAEIVEARENTVLLDASTPFDAAQVPTGDPFGVLVDGIHGSATGHAMLAANVCRGLGISPPPVVPPPQVAGLTTGSITSSSIRVMWTRSPRTSAYQVEHKASSTSTWAVTAAAMTPADVVIAGLTASTGYDFRVTPANFSGPGPVSAVVTASTVASADTTSPSVPTGLAAGTVTSSAVPLSWNPSTDDTGVSKYRVRRGGVVVGEPTTPTFTDTGLTAATAYSYTVSALDAAGNESAQSGAVTATTTANASGGVADDFNRSDSTTSLGPTPGGVAWTHAANSWGISGNAAYFPGSAGDASASVPLSGGTAVADQRVRVVLSAPSVNFLGLTLRQAAGSYVGYIAFLSLYGSSTPSIWKATPSYSKLIDGATVSNWAAGDVVEFSVTGSSLTLTRNGTTVASVSDSSYSSGPRCGLFMLSANPAARVDSFTATPL